MEGLAILEGDRIIDANQIFWAIAGFDPADPPNDIDVGTVLPTHRSRIAQAEGSGFVETELRDVRGRIVCVETAVRHAPINGNRREMIVVRDITERKAAAAKIAHLASHDPLTGCANRLSMSDVMTEVLARSSVETPAAMLCLDLDRFKAVNDIFGHAEGDRILCKIATILQRATEDSTTIARLGGDEFAIIQTGQQQPDGARRLARLILDGVAAEMDVVRDPTAVGVSMGIAVYPADGATAEQLCCNADTALYRAKHAGRGKACFFDAEMDACVRARREIENELRHAITRNQLYVHYQPILESKTGAIGGY
jgi:diguanylate cyclase (GGDEF)-like protein